MALSKAKKAIIHVAKAQLQMADEDYRSVLQRTAGVSSSTSLDERGFESVMAEFERLGFRHPKRRAPARRAGMASPAQVAKIRGIWQAYTGKDDDLALGRWLDKHLHVSHVQFLNGEGAGKAVAILMKMKDRKAAKQSESSTVVSRGKTV